MENNGVRRGAWSKEEDLLLKDCIQKFGEGKWHLVPLRAGLNRCRKSCRVRWINYLRPDLKRGYFSKDEVDLVVRLHKLLGNRWSFIAGRLPGRTGNEVKNFWNTHISKKPPSSSRAVKTITKSNILRPRPLTISNSHRPHWFTRLASSSNQITTKKPSSSSPSSLLSLEKSNDQCTGNINPINNAPSLEEDLDECLRWWRNLLDMAENGGEETPFSIPDDGKGITEAMFVGEGEGEGEANHEGFQLN